MNEILIASIGNSYVDFSKLDLSPWKIQGGKLSDENTRKKIVEEFQIIEIAWDRIVEATQRGNSSGLYVDYEHRSLLWPLDKNDQPNESDFYEVINILRILHPSELYIHNIFSTTYDQGLGTQISSWSQSESYVWNKYDKPEQHFFIYPEDQFSETNALLQIFKKYKDINYISNAIKYYSDSFYVNSPEMSFICLCICLETIVSGREQLSFSFRRNLAVLCSNSEEEGKNIFENARLLYNYRSALVHSGMSKKNYEKFDLFFKYAQFLSSRMIIEMVLHNIPSIEGLDKKITELGFGNKHKISENYKEIISNKISWQEVSDYNLR
ncbi:HEPN domain-containing protein [Chryseobacterium luquanense]|uniref:HEPN domain-containing protein n=1 Tax=Chryseobacterium luquanense TaxID=2983766 RepID=A0ABT3Y856_9FLAO|nr:HEPN domain-containing protein [Chryseobacterium luquanense]MCX8534350.1 HEPN domain-containing protein [Chryseobacterium luquanense]